MITWINLWLVLIVLIFVGIMIYIPIKERVDSKDKIIQPFNKMSFFSLLLVAGFCTFLVAGIGFIMSIWYPFTNNEIEHGYYEYNEEYITENIVYNERFSDGHSVFVDGKEFVCDDAVVKDVDNFKIMKSEYIWSNGFHKFFYDSIFFKEEQKYQLVIPQKYVDKDFLNTKELRN